MDKSNIRNFVIIAHIDSGKSTLADRFLEITGTVEARNMQPQYLDKMELERERGITIKMAPVRMIYHADRGLTQISTRINADKESGLIYEDLTYKIRGCFFNVYNVLGPGQKENVYKKALESEFVKSDLRFEREKSIEVIYDDRNIGVYRPDFVLEEKVLIEVKALPVIAALQKKQAWNYLKGSNYKLALLVNFGGKKLEVERIIYDSARPTIRENPRLDPRESAQVEQYVLNLIDTPGHSDFAYEVSRALAAVEGAILLVDGAKGVQAQTLSNLRAARKAGLKIIGAVNKIDLLRARIDADGTRMNADNREEKIVRSVAELLEVPEEEIFRVSAKTGHGVRELLEEVVKKVPPPNISVNPRINQRSSAHGASRALIFDSLYDDYKGILAFVRVFGGEFKNGEEVSLIASGAKYKIKEIGFFAPELKPHPKMSAGEIGYIATGLKEPNLVRVGDTIVTADARRSDADKRGYISENQRGNQRLSAVLALPGYKEPTPVVFISFYPDGATKFEELKKGLERLRLTDAALSFEPDANEALGRGFRVGFLGQLHFEITASRLEREFSLKFITSFPSIAYRVKERGAERIVKEAHDFPDNPDVVWQPMIKLEILVPQAYLSPVVNLKNVFDFEVKEIKNMGDNLLIIARMPLAELIRDFDDKLKSVSSGYASFGYELDGEDEAEVERMEILIVGEVVAALTRIVAKKDVEREARSTVERLKELLPKQQFSQALQARAQGRIVARETIPAMRKDVTGYLYGGDRSRKMKLWKKQQRGKEKLKGMARVRLSPEVFREILKK